MTKETHTTTHAEGQSDQSMVTVSVPARFAGIVKDFVRQLEEGEPDTTAHIMNLLPNPAPTAKPIIIRKRTDQSTPELF
jgi:hypothetical protein